MACGGPEGGWAGNVTFKLGDEGIPALMVDEIK